MSETPPENKLQRAVDVLRLGTWTLFTLVVVAILSITVLGPLVATVLVPLVVGGPLGFPVGGILVGALVLVSLVGTAGFVLAETVLY